MTLSLRQLVARAPVAAVAFDMDGTLVDSEVLAEQVVAGWLSRRGVEPRAHVGRDLHGLSWLDIAALLRRVYPAALPEPSTVAEALRGEFHQRFQDSEPQLVPGADVAIRAACAALPTAIVTSSNRESAAHLVARLRLGGQLAAQICAEDCARGKPDALPFQLATERLGCAAGELLVFEDSRAGLASASAAGARAVAITRGDAEAKAHAVAAGHPSLDDFRALPSRFFETLAGGAPRDRPASKP